MQKNKHTVTLTNTTKQNVSYELVRAVRLGIGIGVRVVFGRGITIGVAKIQRFGIGARVKVGRGITIGVA